MFLIWFIHSTTKRSSGTLFVLWTLLLIIWVSLLSCETQNEDKIPDTPLWAPKSQPEAPVESGIDADPIRDRIFLQWYPCESNDLEGYDIYRAVKRENPTEINFEKIITINIYENQASDTSCFDETVKIGTRYMYYLKAFTTEGIESLSSDTIIYQLCEKAELLTPINGVSVGSQPTFSWQNISRPTELVLRLETLQEHQIVWISRFSAREQVEYNFDGSAMDTELSSGQNYRWRIDSINMINPDHTEYAGAESSWQYFMVE